MPSFGKTKPIMDVDMHVYALSWFLFLDTNWVCRINWTVHMVSKSKAHLKVTSPLIASRREVTKRQSLSEVKRN